MDNQGTRVNDPVVDPVVGSTVRDRVATPTYVAPTHIATQHDEGVLPVRNRVQWGPIIAGLVSALAIVILLTILGFGIGASVLDPAQADNDAGIWATIWGAITVILAFFVGGWIAAKTAAVGGEFGGMMNGLLVGITGVLLVIWMTASGLGALFGLVSSNIGDIANLAGDVAQQQGVSPDEAQQQAEETATDVQEQVEEEASQINPETAFDTVRNASIGTFLGLLLPIIAAGIGGYMGHNTRYDLATGTGNP
jgi:hypothetical protein